MEMVAIPEPPVNTSPAGRDLAAAVLAGVMVAREGRSWAPSLRLEARRLDALALGYRRHGHDEFADAHTAAAAVLKAALVTRDLLAAEEHGEPHSSPSRFHVTPAQPVGGVPFDA